MPVERNRPALAGADRRVIFVSGWTTPKIPDQNPNPQHDDRLVRLTLYRRRPMVARLVAAGLARCRR
jgi:hypothetical protein